MVIILNYLLQILHAFVRFSLFIMTIALFCFTKIVNDDDGGGGDDDDDDDDDGNI